MIKDYFILAFGNLKHRGLRSWLTILGIFIGIAAVVSLISLGAGLKEAITGQLGALAVDKLTIQNKGSGFGPPGSTVVEKLNDNDIKIIEGVKGVDKIIPRLIRVGSLEYNEISGFGYAASIPEEQDSINLIYGAFGVEAEEGRVLKAGDKGKIMLGNGFLDTEDFEKKFVVGKHAKINDREHEISGILKATSNFQMNNIVFMMADDMEELFETENEYDILVVQVINKEEVEEVAKEIKRKFREDRNEKPGEESFSVESPLQALGTVNNVLNIINLIVVGIAAISLFVGGVGIANTMYTSVVERTREIGIMKAVGARNSDVLFIFLIESGLLGLVGGIVGALVGVLGSFGVAGMANQAMGGDLFVITISYPLLTGAIGFSFIVGVVSGVLPALQASKLNVVDALRG